MIVIHRMAIGAATIKAIRVVLATVTIVALQAIVAISKRKSSRYVVESNTTPRRRRMTVLAGIAFRSPVSIVNGMACRTSLWCRVVVVITVAVDACDSHMAAIQRIPGRGVIEGHVTPVRGTMAAAAGPSESALMNVSVLVATSAQGRCVSKLVF